MSPARAPRARRWVRRGVAAVAAVISIMLLALTAAMFVNDRRIEADPVRTSGTVLTVTPLRTGIEFVDSEGNTVRPPGGVLYPGLLRAGDRFVVEYARSRPEVVRVAGRSALGGLIMVAFAAIGTWLVAGPLLIWLGRPPRRLGRPGRTVG